MSFDPMGAAIDWLDAYRDASLRIVELYADNAALECSCDGQDVIMGRSAITEYWCQRFVEKPAGELIDFRPEGSSIVVTYAAANAPVQAILDFDLTGKIVRSRCGPVEDAIPLRRAC